MEAEQKREMDWWEVLWKYSIFECSDSAWSLIIVSTYFATFLQVVLHQPGATFGKAVTVGALIIAVISPILGAAADHSGRRQPYLRFFTFGVVLMTAAMGFATTVPMALTLFVLAYVSVNGAFTFFTAMLPAVSNERNVGTILPLTVGIGYAGGLITFFGLKPLVPTDDLAGRVFLPMAIIYLIFALPAMFISPDFEQKSTHKLDIGAAYRRIGQTFKEAQKHRFLFRFLIADFLYENAVASVITLMGLYARNVMHFSAGELTMVFGPSIVVAMLSAWGIFGPLVRKIGPKKSVLVDLGVWLLLFALALVVRPGTTLHLGATTIPDKMLFTIGVAPLAGLGLAGVWTASRVLLTALTPAEKSGEFWGLYNLSGRTASVLGDMTWTAVLIWLGEGLFGYQMALVALAVYVVAGGLMVFALPDARPTAANFVRHA
ncbi:MAG TPA: MFS transporter [Symbiobacteriaceae bacterium]